MSNDMWSGLAAPQSMCISFFGDDNKLMGELKETDGKLEFNGDVEESAERFLNYLCGIFNDRIVELTNG